MRAPAITAFGFALAAALAARAGVAADEATAKTTTATPTTAKTTTSTPTTTTTPITTTAPSVTPRVAASASTTSTTKAAPPASSPRPVLAVASPRATALREPAPRPATDVRVQSRFAVKEKSTQLFAAGEYLSRGDFYNSPGLRVGATFYPLESLGLELQVSHYWSSLNAEAERVKRTLGALPDSHAPTWLLLAGGRYSIGYGKFMVGGLGGAIHFEPQAFIHAGMHAHDGDVGPSADAGLGLLVFLKPKLFVRIDAAIVYEREDRSGQGVSVWGTLPSLGVGGTL
jgi:hypothetical protein